MFELKYVLKNTAPLSFTEKSNDSVLYATKKYVPGSAVRGALADLYINKKSLGNEAHKDQKFYDIFLSGKARFLPAYPALCGKQAMVAPLSVQVAKADGRVKDMAVDNTAEAGYKKISGFIVDDRKAKTITKVEPELQFEFHMSRAEEKERIYGRSSEGSVFNYEYLEPGQMFVGSIVFEDDMKPLADELATMLKDKDIRLGRSKSAQYGSAQVKLMGTAAAEKPLWGNKAYLYLYTPYIPYVASSRTDALAQEIIQTLNSAIGSHISCDALHMYAGTEIIDGYIGVWNMKRERKQALSAGTLIELKMEGLSAEDKAKLTDVMYGGLGDRTEEGFGQLRIWTPLSQAVLADAPKEKIAKRSLSESVKQRAKAILQQRLVEEVKKLAKQDALDAKSAQKCKGTLKRVELLMESNRSKQSIQTEIDNFKQTAKNNLRDTKLKTKADSLLKSLLEQEGVKAPYAGINWATDKLELSSGLASDLRKDLGQDAFNLPEEVVYKNYWLWFARHTAKNLKEQDDTPTLAVTAKVKEGK